MPCFQRLAACRFALVAVVLAGALAGARAAWADDYSIDRVRQLLESGRIVEAKYALLQLKDESGEGDQEAVFELLAAAERKLSTLDRASVSLQKAELALKHGDLRTADLHANAVRRLDSATPDQRQRASDVLDESARLRMELEPLIAPALEQALADFQNGNYAEAKAGLSSVVRSGVSLDQRQRSVVNKYQQRLYELERERGKPFKLDYIPLGVLRAAAHGASTPEDATAAEMLADAPEPSDEAAPAPRPETTPEEEADAKLAELQAQLADAMEAQQGQQEPPAVRQRSEAATPAEPQPEPEKLAMAEMQQEDELLDLPDDEPAEDEQTQPEEPAEAEEQPEDDAFAQAARFDAQRIYTEAVAAYNEGRYPRAIDLLQQLTTTYAQYLDADQLARSRDLLLDARTLMGQPTDLIEQEVETKQVMRERARAEYQNFVSQAREALAAGDTDKARVLVAQADLQWRNAFNNNLFTQQEYEANAAELEQLKREIANVEEQRRQRQIEEQAAELEEEAAQQAAAQEAERQRKIDEALDRLRQLQAELKYEEALQVAEQILFLDPNNPAALLMQDVLRDVIFYREWEQIQRDKETSYFAETNRIQEGLIIPDQIMSFPSDWPEISFRRGNIQSFVESEADRRVLATLEQTRIPASFQDNALEDVLAFVATVTNVNMDVDWESLIDIGIERDTEVTLELREVPARVVLDRVLEKVSPDDFSRADWAVNDGILLVGSEERLRQNRFIVIYDVRDLLYEVPNFTETPALDLDQILQQSAQGGGGGGGSIFQDDETGEAEGLTEEELLDRLLEIIQTNVDPNGWDEAGGETGVIQPLNGNLIITNTAKNHRDIQSLLNQLREIRAIQISVEARFLSVTQEFFEQIGFDVDVYFNAQNNQFESAERQLSALGGGTLANEGLSLLPSEVVNTTFNPGAPGGPGYFVEDFDEQTNTITYAFFPDGVQFGVAQPSPLSIVPVQSNSAGMAEALTSNPFAREVLDLNPALAIAGTFLDDIQVDFLIEATQADRRNVTLNAPRLTFVNGKAANIFVVQQQAFVSDLTPVVGTGAVAFDPTTSSLQSGFTLAVSGVVSADRRFVTMTIITGISNVIGFETGTVSAVAAGSGDNAQSQIATGFFDLPQLAVTQVSTGATIPDKGTLLLGGQRLVTEFEVETGVPVLSKLPIINRFFTNRVETKEESTLLILIKPTILIQNEEQENAFPGLQDALNNPFR